MLTSLLPNLPFEFVQTCKTQSQVPFIRILIEKRISILTIAHKGIAFNSTEPPLEVTVYSELLTDSLDRKDKLNIVCNIYKIMVQ
jgi:hypothetical protein